MMRSIHPFYITVATSVLPLTAGSRAVNAAAPYPQSSIVLGVNFDWTTHQRPVGGSDNWPLTWADDDHQYTSWGDGEGFGGVSFGPDRVSLGFARIEGPKNGLMGFNVWGGKDAENPATFGGKSYGMISVGGVLYAWVGPGSNSEFFSESRLHQSTDHAATWTPATWAFGPAQDIIAPTILNFGKDYASARDGFVYHYLIRLQGSPVDLRVMIPGMIDLARVPKTAIMDQAAFEFFAGLNIDGNPIWTSDPATRQPVFEDPDGVGWTVSAIHNAGLGRYLLCTEHTTTNQGRLGIFDAPEPWGPWTTVHYAADANLFGAGQLSTQIFFWNFSPKWWGPDGREFVLAFTGGGSNDAMSLIEGTFDVVAPIDVAVRIVDAQNPTMQEEGSLPAGTTQVCAGDELLVEIWVSQVDGGTEGIAGGSVDLLFDSTLVNPTAIDHGSIFNDDPALTTGTIDLPGGLVDDVGGATLATGRGVAPDWALLARVSMTAVGAGPATFSLGLGALAFALAGGMPPLPAAMVDVSETSMLTISDLPGASAGPDIQVCSNASAPSVGGSPTGIGGTPPYSYTWSGSGEGFLDQADAANPLLDPATSGAGMFDVCVTVQDANGCSSGVDCAAITVHPLTPCAITVPTVVIANSAGNAASTTTGLSDYAWQISGGMISVGQGTSGIAWTAPNASLSPVIVTLTVTDANGCMSSCEQSVVVRPCICDLDLNGSVDFADFGLFGPHFSASTSDTAYLDCADFYFDGVIDAADVSFFGASLGLACGDATMPFPDSAHLPPLPCPEPLGSGSSEGASRIARTGTGRPIGVLLETVILPARSAHGAADVAPVSWPGPIAVGQAFVAELWVRIDGNAPAGLIGGTVDVVVDKTLATIVNATVDTIFGLFARGDVNAASGLARGVGGATLRGGVAVGEWARLATVDLVATSVGTLRVQTSQGPLGFAVYGVGAIPDQALSTNVAAIRIGPASVEPSQKARRVVPRGGS